MPTGTVISVLARHHVGDRPVDVGLEAQIAVGQDADQPAFLAAVLGDRHAGDAVLLHQLERFVDPVGRGERDRIDDHAALRPLHAIDFRRLLLDRQVLVDDAEAAVLRHRDRQPRLGDGVHRRADERHVQPDVAREPGADVDLVGQHRRVLRHEQDVVEGQGGRQAGVGRRRSVEASVFSSMDLSDIGRLHVGLTQTAVAPSCRGPVALLVFLSAAARTRIVAADLRLVAPHRLHRRVVAADARRLLLLRRG